jgi:hypothetical protein
VVSGQFSVDDLQTQMGSLLSPLQSCLQLADMRQGTTSVVPQMVHPDSGISRYEAASN